MSTSYLHTHTQGACFEMSYVGHELMFNWAACTCVAGDRCGVWPETLGGVLDFEFVSRFTGRHFSKIT